jgi:hypothetical protein
MELGMASATARLIHLAIYQRDLIERALLHDRNCAKTQSRLKDWHAGRVCVVPMGRMIRLYGLWYPREGFGIFDRTYREAISEVGASGMGAFFLPKLERVKTAHEQLIYDARSAYDRSETTPLPSIVDHCHAVSDLSNHLSALNSQTAALPKTPGERPLSTRQKEILQAMKLLGAANEANRKTIGEIAVRVEGKGALVENYKKSIAALKKRRFVQTLDGRGGGCWLLPSAIELLANGEKR